MVVDSWCYKQIKYLIASIKNYNPTRNTYWDRLVFLEIKKGAGTPIYDVGQEEVDYTNKYKKETLKASLQNYVLNQLNYGVDNIPLFFIFELEGFGKFDYSDFVGSLSNYTLEVISNNLKNTLKNFLNLITILTH